MPQACKGNAPVKVEKYVFLQAIKREHEYGCVYASSLNKSPVHSYLCVCNGSAIKEVPQDVCVCLYTRKTKGIHVCVCHHHSPVDSFLCVYVCICMLTPLIDCDYMRQLFYC